MNRPGCGANFLLRPGGTLASGDTTDFVREVNDSIADLGDRFGLTEDSLELICECGDPACAERVRIPAVDYERLRTGRPGRVVLPGHERGAVARSARGYVVLSD